MAENPPMLVAGLGQCSWDTLFFVDIYPPVDAKQEATGVMEQGGGPVATALVALGRMGIGARFAGVAGGDEAGLRIRESLVSEGVDTSGLVLRPGLTSQLAFIAVERATARRTIFWQRPTGGPMSPDELPRGFLDGASLLLLDGLMPEASMRLASEARERGIPVLLDAGRLREGMPGLAALCAHVVGSERFGADMGMDPERPEGFAARALELFPQGLTITLGRRGAVRYSLEGGVPAYMHVPAFEVGAVDTTGAGDVFHAGYAYGVLRGFDIEGTLGFASAAAALSTRALGGRSALPSEDDVSRFMEAGQK